MTNEALDLLFSENKTDVKKNQSYKDVFKEYDLPDKYFLLEMYNKQKELQTFLADRGKTERFPDRVDQVRQHDVQLSIYHLFCMQVELEELAVELAKLASNEVSEHEDQAIDARYELIDMFFFMFNVGIYSGLDFMKVVNELEKFKPQDPSSPEEITMTYNSVVHLKRAVELLINYIDKLPWKAWKEYDYNNLDLDESLLTKTFALAIYEMLIYAKQALGEDDRSLFNLYMNKWEENKRRQLDVTSGYILPKEDSLSDNNESTSNNF